MSKKMQAALGGKRVASADPDSDMDDCERNPSGTMKKGRNSSSGHRSATAEDVDGAREAAALALAAKELVAVRRAALAPLVYPQFDSMRLCGGEVRSLAEVRLGTPAAAAALKSGKPTKWLFMLDNSQSMNLVREGESEAAGLAMIKQLFQALPDLLKATVGGLDSQIAFGKFGSQASVYPAGHVAGYTPWMRLGDAIEGNVLAPMAQQFRADGGCTDIEKAIVAMANAVDEARDFDDARKGEVVSVVWVTDGNATEGQCDPDQLKIQLDDWLCGSATISSAIAVGCRVGHETIRGFVSGSGGYYGYAPDLDCFNAQLEAVVLPFKVSNKAFLLEISDQLSADEWNPRRLCLGMLHSGNCKRLISLGAKRRISEGNWCGANVSLVDDFGGCGWARTSVLFKYVALDDEGWVASREQLAGGPLALALADEKFELRYQSDVLDALSTSSAQVALERFDELLTGPDAAAVTADVRARACLFRERLSARVKIEAAPDFKAGLSGGGLGHAMLFMQASASYSQTSPSVPAGAVATASAEVV